jgi:hypothetical protein
VRIFQVRIEQALVSQSAPLIAFQLQHRLAFYCRTFEALLPAVPAASEAPVSTALLVGGTTGDAVAVAEPVSFAAALTIKPRCVSNQLCILIPPTY